MSSTAPTKRAINAALELFHRRWVLRILWELRGEPLNFRALQEATGGLSASVLNRRLQELRDALLVVHDAGSGGYQLTGLGRELLVALEPLMRWSVRWMKSVERGA